MSLWFCTFVAERLGLPLIPRYFGIKGSGSVVAFRQGVNYAVAGSTAIDSSFVEAKESGSVVINGSLGVQLSWFKQSLPSICGNTSGTIGVFIVFRCVFHALEILKTGITLFYLANCRIIKRENHEIGHCNAVFAKMATGHPLTSRFKILKRHMSFF
ncbi:putative sinapine esterase [Helianthus annuus]|nr:putative sinapine esterase [Helianthus annuus]KAJ0461951.1 putative sinapine esterase [Helianthus annuus]